MAMSGLPLRFYAAGPSFRDHPLWGRESHTGDVNKRGTGGFYTMLKS